jgi:hypothetical protein
MPLNKRFDLRKITAALAGSVVSAALAPAARADFVENFDPQGPDGYVLFTGDSNYITTVSNGSTGGNSIGNVYQNAYIDQSIFNITNDQSGPGYFLYDQTVSEGNETYNGMVWETINPTPVTPNTNYTYSFYLTNRDSLNPAAIEPYINGAAIGGPVSANGIFGDGGAGDQWQQFSFTWNSGANTTADLGLYNLTTYGDGNDFGIDTISLTTVPEPGTLGLASVGAFTLMRRRRGTAP